MLDTINIYITDKKFLKKIDDKLDKIIALLEKDDSDIEGLDQAIENLESINQQVKTIV